MATRTTIKRRCPKCNYTYSCTYVSKNFLLDPLGTPLVRCEFCKNISTDPKRREWIQMSSIKKIFAISSIAYTIWIIWAFIAVFGVIGSIFFDISMLGETIVWSFKSLIFTLLICYFIIKKSVNGDKFIQRYVLSIRRTNNQAYRELLKTMGPLFDESLPLNLQFSENSKWRIADLHEKYGEVKSMEDIVNSIYQSVTDY